MLIGFSGYARAGKDTAGAALAHRGFERRSFADPLKRLAALIGWNGEKDEVGRVFLQDIGHGAREVLGDDVWIRAALGDLLDDWPDVDPRIVMTDVRYENEANAIRGLGGYVVRIDRPDIGPANEHVTEIGLDDYDFDARILNDSIPNLRRRVYDLVDELR